MQEPIKSPKDLAVLMMDLAGEDPAYLEELRRKTGLKATPTVDVLEDFLTLNLPAFRAVQQQQGGGDWKNVLHQSLLMADHVHIGDIVHLHLGGKTDDLAQLKTNLRAKVLHDFRQFQYPDSTHDYLQLPIQTRMAEVTPFSKVENRHQAQQDITDERIQQVFDRFGGELLLLGEPGAGKTTLLYELGNVLATEGKYKPERPVPVLVNLSSWAAVPLAKDAPTAQAFLTWLEGELRQQYGLSAKALTLLLDAQHLALLLDGLDEVEESRRADCVDAINAFREQHRIPTAVCSRSIEYRALSQGPSTHKLRLEAAVELLFLTDDQLDAYFQKNNLTDLRAAYIASDALQEVLRTPLWLYIASRTYKKSAAPAPEMDAEAWKTRLMETYEDWLLGEKKDMEDKKLAERHPAPPYSVHTLEQGMAWLAYMLDRDDQTLLYVERLQPDWLPASQRGRYRLAAHLLEGLAFGLALGLARGLALGLAAGLAIGLEPYLERIFATFLPARLAGGLAGGLAFGLAGGLAFGLALGLALGLAVGLLRLLGGKSDDLPPVEIAEHFQFSRSSLSASNLAVGLVSGLAGGLAFGLAGGLAVGLAVGLAGGLVGGLMGVVQSNTYDLQTTHVPNQGIHQTRKYALLGLFPGLILLLLVWYWRDTLCAYEIAGDFNLTDLGYVVAAILMVLIPMHALGGNGWMRHYLIRHLLRRAGYVPYDFVAFLAYAARLGYLKRVGGAYTFYHKAFRDYLVREYRLRFYKEYPRKWGKRT